MSYGTVQAEKMTTESGYSLGAGNASSFKNRIINGGMVIDQRNAGASVTSSSNALYFLDRYRSIQTISFNNKFSVQQNAGSVTPPVGFTNYLGATSLSAFSIGASDTGGFGQGIEGLNIADLAWGTANARPVTVSFWARSSLTGTFAGSIQNASQTRSYPFTFTIPSANTWTAIALTIPGDTSGTWLTSNAAGLFLWFSLGSGADWQATANAWGAGEKYGVSGQVNVASTNGATFYITGVQLEVGTVATSFDFRDYGRELIMCQRYYERITSLVGNGPSFPCFMNASNVVDAMVHWLVQKRATPTVSGSTGTNHFGCEIGNAGFTMNAFLGSYQPSQYGARCRFQFNSGTSTVALAGYVTIQNTSAYIDASSEL